MIRTVLLFILISLSGLQTQAASSFSKLTCDGFTTGLVSKLGIGALVRDENGSLLLGVSPYAGSLHDNIIYELLETSEVAEIVWMGEVRYSKVGETIQLHEANETSGFYSRHANKSLINREHPIPVGNSINNLPGIARAQDFRAYTFQSGEKFRLAEELREVKGDVRHSIGNSLNIVSSVANILTSPSFTPERRTTATSTLKAKDASHLKLVRWLIENLIEDNRVTEDSIKELHQFVMELLKKNWSASDFENIDASKIQSQIQKIAAFTVPGKVPGSIEIYRLSAESR